MVGIPDDRPNRSCVQNALSQTTESLSSTVMAELERTALHMVRTEAALTQHHATLRAVSSARMALTAYQVSVNDLLAAHLGLPASRAAIGAETLRLLAGEMLNITEPGRAVSRERLTNLYLQARRDRPSLPVVPSQRGGPRSASAISELVAFCNRDDLPVLQQAMSVAVASEAVAGGDRLLGPALFQVVLRRRGTTTACMLAGLLHG